MTCALVSVKVKRLSGICVFLFFKQGMPRFSAHQAPHIYGLGPVINLRKLVILLLCICLLSFLFPYFSGVSFYDFDLFTQFLVCEICDVIGLSFLSMVFLCFY